MRRSDTLTFDLSDEQERVLTGVAAGPAVAEDAKLEGSFRAWNAHFVPPSTPLEASLSKQEATSK
ncbi:MAG: hypothetical protein QOE98_1571 [Gaiellaceae bacterium]|jgi:hypothetical protein|nr:hypothetical protein [Gaiellaceae bacterium]MEA2467713.1 hypothetical protein [Thermoleophilaceae bacterium]